MWAIGGRKLGLAHQTSAEEALTGKTQLQFQLRTVFTALTCDLVIPLATSQTESTEYTH